MTSKWQELPASLDDFFALFTSTCTTSEVRRSLNYNYNTCGPTGGERKLEGRKVIGVTSPHELSSPLVLLMSACIIIGNLIRSFLTSSHLISFHLIFSHLILSHLILTHLMSSYHSLSYLILPFLILSYIISLRSISYPLISP